MLKLSAAKSYLSFLILFSHLRQWLPLEIVANGKFEFKKLRGYVDLKILMSSLRPAAQPLKKAA
jgi:hypothetical protein